MRKVAIQGVKGCFHDNAAHLFFKGEDLDIVPCESFADLFTRVERDKEMVGIVAIENTIAGSLIGNYELMRKSGLTIVGEHKLRINQTICALPGQHISELTEVLSHPIALMQCGDFLEKHRNLKAVEFDDTANAAKTIAAQKLNGIGAICGKYAAELYGLEVLEENIETNKHNFTRFLILDHTKMLTEGKKKNKSTVAFSVQHTPGSLSKILTIISFYDINLTKIQSMPIIGKEWEYLFYLDLTYDDYDRYKQAVEAFQPLTNSFKNLGEYVEGEPTV